MKSGVGEICYLGQASGLTFSFLPASQALLVIGGCELTRELTSMHQSDEAL